jgi:phosphatidylglycerophosphatase A
MSFYKLFSTCGFVGYLPGPGTFATLATLPLVYWLGQHFSVFTYGMVIVALTIVSYFIVKQALREFGLNDPCCIVIDEVIGTLVTFWGISFNLTTAVIGFLAFRFFDISKPSIIRTIDRMRGPGPVIADDIAAGLYANLVIRIALYFTVS